MLMIAISAAPRRPRRPLCHDGRIRMTTPAPSLLISNVRLPDGRAAAVSIEGGRIAALGPGVTAAPGVTVEDGRGALLLPGFVEGHTHIDKSNWGRPWYRNEVGPAL